MSEEAGIEHPYALYNKNEKTTATLIGNWQEERCMKDLTGFARYEVHVDVNEDPELFATRHDKHLPVPTHPRIIEHVSSQQHPKDWRSVTTTAYRNPSEQPAFGVYKGVPSKGPRAALEESLMRSAAEQLPAEIEYKLTGAPIPATTRSVYGADFLKHDLTGMKIGALVMKDLDGRPRKHDPTFLAEANLLSKQKADRLLAASAAEAGATSTSLMSNPDAPITIYSEAVANRSFGGTCQGTKVMNPSAPFNKFSNFSKQIGEYNKVVDDE